MLFNLCQVNRQWAYCQPHIHVVLKRLFVMLCFTNFVSNLIMKGFIQEES